MRRILLVLAVFLGSLGAMAQTLTITGTATDSDSIAWAGGSWQLSFRPNPAFPNLSQYFVNGVALSTAYPTLLNQSGALNNSGAFSVTTVNNSLITPTGSSWTFTICPLATSACGSFFIPTTSSGDISTTVDANILAPRFAPVSGTYGYADGEAILQLKPGSTYWNVSTPTQRCYTGSSWVSCGSGGGGGVTPSAPAYSVQIANAALNGLSSDPNILINTTTHTFNVGTLPQYFVTIAPQGFMTGSWTFDTTSPNAALLSLGPVPYTDITGPNGSTNCLVWNGASPALLSTTPCGGSGSVTSVALSMDSRFSVSGSPVTGAGTLSVTTNTTGTGAKLVTATAAGTSGDCVQWTSAGDAGDSGVPCASSAVTQSASLIASDGETGSRQFNQVSNPETTPPTGSYVYQNTSGKRLLVTISADGGGGGFHGVVFCDSASSPTTIIGRFGRVNAGSSNPNYYPSSISFMVAPGYYYGVSVTDGGGPPVGSNAKDSWTEWTF